MFERWSRHDVPMDDFMLPSIRTGVGSGIIYRPSDPHGSIFGAALLVLRRFFTTLPGDVEDCSGKSMFLSA